MPKLKGSEALDQCLSFLLQNAGIIKLGCRLSDDVTKLHRSYPDMQAFQGAVALLDLTSPWTMYMQENNDQVWLTAVCPDKSCPISITYTLKCGFEMLLRLSGPSAVKKEAFCLSCTPQYTASADTILLLDYWELPSRLNSNDCNEHLVSDGTWVL